MRRMKVLFHPWKKGFGFFFSLVVSRAHIGTWQVWVSAEIN
jgi:hypothetical protein